MRPLPTRTAQGYVVKLIWGTYRLEIEKTNNGNNFNHRSWVASSISKRLFNAVGFEPDRDILVSCDNERTVDSIKKGDIEVKTKMKHAGIYTGLGKKHEASGLRRWTDIKASNCPKFYGSRNIKISKIYLISKT